MVSLLLLQLYVTLYGILKQVPTGMGILLAADSAFSCGDMVWCIILPLKSVELDLLGRAGLVKQFVALEKKHCLAVSIGQTAVSIGQAVKWGMRGLQSMG
jgi:hypothetical protein